MKTDLRVKKTLAAIKTAFIELMDEEGFDKMTASEIIKRAKINRTTFYVHYQDKFDLLDKLEDDFLQGIGALELPLPTEKMLKESQPEDILKLFAPVFTYLRTNSKLMILLLDPVKGDAKFLGKLTLTIKENWAKHQMLERLNIPEGYALAAATGMMSSLIGEWVARDFKESPEEFSKIAISLIKNIPGSLFQLEA